MSDDSEIVYDWPNEQESVHAAVYNALKQDNRDKFVYLVNSCREEDDPLKGIWPSMFMLDSANCAAALLDGEFGPCDLSWPPLHLVAALQATRMIKLFLENGIEADTKSDWDLMNLKMALPLHVALGTLGESYGASYLDRGDSAVKLIFKLCCEATRPRLDVLRLLAENTKGLKHEFSKYLKDGKIAEVGALLMVASKELLSSSASEEGEICFNSILDMRKFVLSEISLCVSDKLKKELLLLLNIFHAIGDKLVAYTLLDPPFRKEVCLYVKVLLEEAGFLVDKLDDIYNFNYPISKFHGKFRDVLEQDGLLQVGLSGGHQADCGEDPLLLSVDRPYKEQKFRGMNKETVWFPISSSCVLRMNDRRLLHSAPLLDRPYKEQKLPGMNKKPISSCVSFERGISSAPLVDTPYKKPKQLGMNKKYGWVFPPSNNKRCLMPSATSQRLQMCSCMWVSPFVATIKRGARLL